MYLPTTNYGTITRIMIKFLEFIKKKSLKERFLLVIGFLFFLIYFVLGATMLLWESMPIEMLPKYRMLFGGLLIGYSFLRFYRYWNDNKN